MPHFFFFPYIPDSIETRDFLFCDFWEYHLRGEKKFVPFSYVCFSVGVHFTAFGILEHFMNAVSVCITETQSLSCVLFTFCIMGLNIGQKSDMSWSPAVMYSVCKPDISETSKSDPVYALFAIIRAYTTKNLKETCYTCTLQRPV